MDDQNGIEPGQSCEVDLFRPEDAQGVVQLFLGVYGEGYPIKTYIDPQRLTEENAAGRTISSVARTPRGDIVGHNALFRSAPYEGICESGAGLVHKLYRGGKGIFTRLVAHGQEKAAEAFGIQGIFGEAVCNHVFSQKLTHRLGWITHAVEVDLMPAAAYTKEKSAQGRVASLVDFITIQPRPHRVFLPAAYREELAFIYAGLDDRRDIRVSGDPFPRDSESQIHSNYFPFAQVARLAVRRTGLDFQDRITDLEQEMTAQGAAILQVSLNLSEPWIGEAVQILREKDYFMGGILPRWFDDDGFLMLKILHPPSWDDIQIHFDRAKKILNFVKNDWKRVAMRSA